MMTRIAAPFRAVGCMRPGRFAVFLFALGLIPRLIVVLLLGQSPLGVDEVEYDLIAANLASGQGYSWYMGLPTAFRPPGYVFFLSAIYAVAGHSFYIARIVQAVITGFHGVLTYAVGRRVFGEQAGRWSGVFVAAYVPLVLYAVGLLTENLFIPVLLLGVLFLLRSRGERRWRWTIAAGLTLGAAVLIRPDFTLFLALLLPWYGLPERNWRRAAGQTGVICGIVAVMVIPWCVRNYNHTGQFVYLDTRPGYNLYIGYREEADGSFDMDAAIELAELYRDAMISGEADSDVIMHNWGKAQALAFIRAHPLRALGLVPLRFMHFWNLEHRMFLFAYSYNYVGALPPAAVIGLMALLMSPFAFLCLAGVVGTAYGERTAGLALLLLLLGYYTALHCAVFGEARLHFPLVPIIAMAAGAGVGLWPRFLKGAGGDRRRRAAVAAVMIGLIAMWSWGIAESVDRWKAVLSPGGNTAQLPY